MFSRSQDTEWECDLNLTYPPAPEVYKIFQNRFKHLFKSINYLAFILMLKSSHMKQMYNF